MDTHQGEFMTIRLAADRDIAAICSFAPEGPREGRRDHIEESLRTGKLYVAVVDDTVAAYAIFDDWFFCQPFIAMLYVRADFRRQGLGQALVTHLESVCDQEKLFTSTNESNLPMQRLLAKRGFRQSGIIHNLDEGDPEIVYVKDLKAAG